MATTNFTVAVELGSSHISGIAGRKAPDGSLEVLAYACQDSTSFVHKGVVYNIEKASQALGYIISQLESQLHSSIAKVYVGIGGQSLRTVVNTVNHTLQEKGIISAKLVDSLCDENREMSIVDMDVLDVAPQEYKIDHMLQADPVGVTGQHITAQYLNIVARSSLKKNIELSFEQARMPVADFIIAPVALAQLMLAENDRRAGCALVDFGAGTTTVLVYKNNILRYLCVLPLGGNNITHDLANLKIEETEAEQLKLHYGDAFYQEAEDENATPATCLLDDGRSVKLRELNDIVGARAEEILANAWNQIQLSGYENELFSGIVLTGGNANLTNTETLFRSLSHTEKVRTAHSIQEAVQGERLPEDGRQNTLLGLLEAGTENCCVPEKPKPSPEPEQGSLDLDVEVVQKPEEQKPADAENSKGHKTGSTTSQSQKDETKTGKQEKKTWFRSLFDNIQKEMIEDSSDSMDDRKH